MDDDKDAVIASLRAELTESRKRYEEARAQMAQMQDTLNRLTDKIDALTSRRKKRKLKSASNTSDSDTDQTTTTEGTVTTVEETEMGSEPEESPRNLPNDPRDTLTPTLRTIPHEESPWIKVGGKRQRTTTAEPTKPISNKINDKRPTVPQNNPKPTPGPAPKQTPSQGTVPIIMRQAEKWRQVEKELAKLKISFISAKRVFLGIQIVPETTTDHRRLTRLLTDLKIQYHTYFLPEDKMLKVVIRGLYGQSAEDVKEDLEAKGFHPTECHFLKQQQNGAYKLIKVLLPKTETEVFNIEHILRLRVKIEAQQPKKGMAQCHNCQQFGHSAINCHAQPRCVKCEGLHHFSECSKKTEEKAVCTNCKGEHPASYGGCPRNPTNVRKTFAQVAKAASNKPQTVPPQKSSPTPRTNTPSSAPQNKPPTPPALGPMDTLFTGMKGELQTALQDMLLRLVQGMFGAPSTIQANANH